MQHRDLFKKAAMSGIELVLVAASVTKLANLIEREKLAEAFQKLLSQQTKTS